MDVRRLAQDLSSFGRGADTSLVHMTPSEVLSLQSLAEQQGGSLSINPETGLPEAGFLKDLLPTIAGIGLGALFPGLSPLTVGLIAGAGNVALGDKRHSPLMRFGLGALGGYGGGSLAQGLAAGGGFGAAFNDPAKFAKGFAPFSGAPAWLSGTSGLGISGAAALAPAAMAYPESGGFPQSSARMAMTDDEYEKWLKRQQERYAMGRQPIDYGGAPSPFGRERPYFTPSVAYRPNFLGGPSPASLYANQGGIVSLQSGGAVSLANPALEVDRFAAPGQPTFRPYTRYIPGYGLSSEGSYGFNPVPVFPSIPSPPPESPSPPPGNLLPIFDPGDNDPDDEEEEEDEGEATFAHEVFANQPHGGLVSFIEIDDKEDDAIPAIEAGVAAEQAAQAAQAQAALDALTTAEAFITEPATIAPAPVFSAPAPTPGPAPTPTPTPAPAPAPTPAQAADAAAAEAAQAIAAEEAEEAAGGAPTGYAAPQDEHDMGFTGFSNFADEFDDYGSYSSGEDDYFDEGSFTGDDPDEPGGWTRSGGLISLREGGLPRVGDTDSFSPAFGYFDPEDEDEDETFAPASTFGGVGDVIGRGVDQAVAYAKGRFNEENMPVTAMQGLAALFAPTGVGAFLSLAGALSDVLSEDEYSEYSGVGGHAGADDTSDNPDPAASDAPSGMDEGIDEAAGERAYGGLISLMGGGLVPDYAGGGLLIGRGDGMSDSIHGSIEGVRPARLADGEFVVPADVVAHIGNGSTNAGADKLYGMMDRVRKARTNSKRQAPEVNTRRMLPA